MVFAQQQQPVQQQQQEQALTHQQIQALELLAAPAVDLQGLIVKEMEKNPVLEASNDDEPLQAIPEQEAPENDPERDWAESLVQLADTLPVYRRSTRSWSPEDEQRREHFLSSITPKETLHDTIEEQLRFAGLNADTQERCELIVSSLDEEGYLRGHPADLAMASGCSLDAIEEALAVVQSCEPAGIATRDLRERLMIQLQRRGGQESLAYRVVADHLADLGANRMPVITRALQVNLDELRAAIAEIRSLDPHLSRPESVAQSEYVQEEVEVVEEDGRLEVRLNSNRVPNLRISAHYRTLLRDPDTPADVRTYIRDKIRGAAFLINSLHQRQSTLERITQAIVEVQEGFFRAGMEHMKPLTMAQVAQRIGVHETTVSRGVAGKFMRCRYGLIPLRRFFTAGLEDTDGESVSNVVIKNRINKLIETENQAKPLSDSRISKLLHEQGLQVARRTVAKYRESLGILASNLRRQYW